jgi:hypothetical protein
LYQSLLPWASAVLLTEVHRQHEGDVFLPFDPDDLVNSHGFHIVVVDKGEVKHRNEDTDMEWTFRLYTRRHADDAGCP